MPKSFAPAGRCFNLQMPSNKVGTPQSKVCTGDKIIWLCKFDSCQCQGPGVNVLSLQKVALPSTVEGGTTGRHTPAVPLCNILKGISPSPSPTIECPVSGLAEEEVHPNLWGAGDWEEPVGACSLPVPSRESPEIVHTCWNEVVEGHPCGEEKHLFHAGCS